jgi:hypothetical protein
MSRHPLGTPRLPRNPDDCTQAEWDDWVRRHNAWLESVLGPRQFKPVSRAGW